MNILSFFYPAIGLIIPIILILTVRFVLEFFRHKKNGKKQNSISKV